MSWPDVTRGLVAALIAAGGMALVAGSDLMMSWVDRLQRWLAPPAAPRSSFFNFPPPFPPYVGALMNVCLLLILSGLTLAVTWWVQWLLAPRRVGATTPPRRWLAVVAGLGAGPVAGIAVGLWIMRSDGVGRWLRSVGPSELVWSLGFSGAELVPALRSGAAAWLPITLAAAVPYALLSCRRKQRNLFGPACPACGYSLRGLNSPRCPECGHALAEPAPAGSPPIVWLLPSFLVGWPFVHFLYELVRWREPLQMEFVVAEVLQQPIRPVVVILVALRPRWVRAAALVGIVWLLIVDLRETLVFIDVKLTVPPVGYFAQMGSDAVACALALFSLRTSAQGASHRS